MGKYVAISLAHGLKCVHKPSLYISTSIYLSIKRLVIIK